MRTASRQAGGWLRDAGTAVVTGALCLIILGSLAVVKPPSITSSAFLESLAPAPATWRSSQCAVDAADQSPVTLTIQNDGNESDLLLGATTPVARCVKLHRSQLVQGQPQVLPVPGGLIVPAATTVTLEQGTDHLVLVGLRSDLVQGDIFPLTLHFDRAGELQVVARVRRRVDAAGSMPLPPVSACELTVTGVSAQPASAPNAA